MRLKKKSTKKGKKPKSVSLIYAPDYKTMIISYKENKKWIMKFKSQSTQYRMVTLKVKSNKKR
jgi:hypothetical protein